MAIFDKRKSLSRKEFKTSLRESSGRIPRTGGQKYGRGEREKMARETFGWRYGSEISRTDYRKAIRGLESAKKRVKTPTERSTLDKKIRYLRELGGKNI